MKKIALGFATCGLILSSCSSNDVFEDNQGTNNPNAINFSATTTRATVNDLTEVKKGFPVYAVTTNEALAWHIQGAIYENKGSWLWKDNAQKWPELAKFPMNFYAYYPATHPGYAINDDIHAPIKGNAGVLSSVITIQSTAEAQADYLAANTTGIVRPMTTVPLQFKHITTKINFGVIAAEGTKSYVQQMNINNVKNQGTYNYVTTTDANKWGYTDNGVNGAVPNKYDYFGNPVGQATTKPVVVFTKTGTNFYPCTPVVDGTNQPNEAADDKNLMLLPQAGTPVWTPAIFTGSELPTPSITGEQKYEMPDSPAGKTITPLNAYIGSVYRMTDGATDPAKEKDLVGYATAKSHPNWSTSQHKPNGVVYEGPLFVKVGFPLAPKVDDTNPTFSWIMGSAYTYNISLGGLTSTGGYLLDNRYYDKYGNPTDLLIGGTDPGEPVSGGTINFDVTVGNWEDGQLPGGGTENENGSGESIN